MELEERQGFGFAVLHAMPRVTTPVLLVAQHDRSFLRDVDVYGCVQLLLRYPLRYKYIGFHTKCGGLLPLLLLMLPSSLTAPSRR